MYNFLDEMIDSELKNTNIFLYKSIRENKSKDKDNNKENSLNDKNKNIFKEDTKKINMRMKSSSLNKKISNNFMSDENLKERERKKTLSNNQIANNLNNPLMTSNNNYGLNTNIITTNNKTNRKKLVKKRLTNHELSFIRSPNFP